MGFFDNLPERLEVTDPGFTTIVLPHEIIYWRVNDSVAIFGLVFDKHLWYTLIGLLVFSTCYLFVLAKEPKSLVTIIHTLALTLKLLFGLDDGGLCLKV